MQKDCGGVIRHPSHLTQHCRVPAEGGGLQADGYQGHDEEEEENDGERTSQSLLDSV